MTVALRVTLWPALDGLGVADEEVAVAVWACADLDFRSHEFSGCVVYSAEEPDMTTIQIELPDATAQAARDAGLLTPQALARMLNEALRRKQAASSLLTIADRVAAAGIAPLSAGEIGAEVKAARAGRRAGGH